MTALFPPYSNGIYRAVLVAIPAFVTVAIVAPMLYIRTPYAANVADPVEQPVEFDHRHHVRDDGIDCVYCHESVETSARAGIPPTERCMGCHAQVWVNSPELAKVRASWTTGTPLPWKRVTAVPGFVYFHHGVHVQAGIACARCHGRVEDMPRVRREHRMTMDFCVNCHRERTGTRAINRLTTCSACHR